MKEPGEASHDDFKELLTTSQTAVYTFDVFLSLDVFIAQYWMYDILLSHSEFKYCSVYLGLFTTSFHMDV